MVGGLLLGIHSHQYDFHLHGPHVYNILIAIKKVNNDKKINEKFKLLDTLNAKRYMLFLFKIFILGQNLGQTYTKSPQTPINTAFSKKNCT